MIIVSTAVGPIEIEWNEHAVTRVRLLESGKTKKSAKAPAFARDLATMLAQHFSGRTQDFSKVPLDYSNVPAFHAKVYEASRKVKSGSLVGYGELAARAGSPGASRAVGQAMARNPFFVVVPCHRVAAAKPRRSSEAASLTKLGGFSAPGGALTKRRMLEIEGAFLEPPPYDVERAVRELRAADPALAKVIAATGDRRPSMQPLHSLFESLGRSIIYQQLSGLAAGAIHRKYAALFPDHRPTAEHLAHLSDARVRAAGLSGSKLAALRDLAKRSLAGELPTLKHMTKMSDDEIIESLTKVRGIGPWTVHMLLIFRLGRPDVLPVADYGVRKGFQKTYKKRELPNAKALEKYAEKWKPWRSVASWYMWRATELSS
jgi:methylated-DNA-[protein]-cysteine S-methyltransferase